MLDRLARANRIRYKTGALYGLYQSMEPPQHLAEHPRIKKLLSSFG